MAYSATIKLITSLETAQPGGREKKEGSTRHTSTYGSCRLPVPAIPLHTLLPAQHTRPQTDGFDKLTSDELDEKKDDIDGEK